MNALHHLYINPLEKCNLRCRICYTRKTSPVLTEKQILDFIDRYQEECEVQTVTLCGGEVFTLPYITHCISILSQKGIFVQVITNGTIDRLNKMERPNFINLIVSIDGLEDYHDKNRREGNFQKSIDFLKKAKQFGFHTEIFSIVTRQNLAQIDKFEKYINQTLGKTNITYHPRKSLNYLRQHPISNIQGDIDGFDFLTDDELITLIKTKKTFPPKELGCYQISLMSDGEVYGCCEGFEPIGTIDDTINHLIESFKKKLQTSCCNCIQPDFMCGMKKFLNYQVDHDRD